MPENLETSAVATGLEKVRFRSNLKERQCQRIDAFELLHAKAQVAVTGALKRGREKLGGPHA